MMPSTVAVTGGNGKIGSAILSHLNERGYETVNVSRGKQRNDLADEYITTDLLDAGETYGALAKGGADAVIHMGTISSPKDNPEHRTYESNVMSAQHVLEASEALGLEAVCLASSINAMGSEHQQRPADVRYLPIDEEHPRTPDDPYGIAKHAMEITADGVARRPSCDMTISSIRYPWVTNETEMREHFVDRDRSLAGLSEVHPATGRDVLFSYLYLDDAASVARKAVEAVFTGHEIFWAVASDTTADTQSTRLIDEYFPEAEVQTEFENHDSLISTSKAAAMLDWEPQRSWRDDH